MDRYLIVSADGHAGPPARVYRDYLEQKYHADFDEQMAQLPSIEKFARMPMKGVLLKAHVHRWKDESTAPLRERSKGAWDSTVRLQEMDSEGICAEILFPDGQFSNDFPFGGFFGHDKPERRIAGAKAHNRWLAEFCSANPVRMHGLAMVIPHDIEDAVAEVRRAHAEGLRGVLLSTAETGLPLYHERRYDPLWATCAELGMPLHFHGGQNPNVYGESNLCSNAISEFEVHFFRRRPMVHLMLGGAFHRFPNLRLVYTEAGFDWIPAQIDKLQYAYQNQSSQIFGITPKKWLPISPRECWDRNCAVGATFASFEELRVWQRLGSHTIMWGADYPHVEATWPNSWAELRRAFAAIPDEDVRKMIGLNAARIYGMDLPALEQLAARIGPPAGTFVNEGDASADVYDETDFAESRVFKHATFERRLKVSLHD